MVKRNLLKGEAMSDAVEATPAAEYEPDESYVKSLFARPARQPKPKAETWIAGESFNGISAEEADDRRYRNLHRQPQRVREEKR
jgi:hypothetical protein